jgi:hypothetical protein
MSLENSLITEPPGPGFALRVSKKWLWSPMVLVAVVVVGALASSYGQAVAKDDAHQVSGAGKTIIEGGTGGVTPGPVLTTVAFHANVQGGDFECLALAPALPTGSGSGEFTVNAMYVTGRVTSVDMDGRTAILRGTATVTGIGAGQNEAFTARVTAGGPGATVVLEVSKLTFREILLEGQISVE